MKPAAILSLVFYTAGMPLTFLFILVRYRYEIYRDQSLRQRNQGNSEQSNPHFQIRRRYQELCVPCPFPLFLVSAGRCCAPLLCINQHIAAPLLERGAGRGGRCACVATWGLGCPARECRAVSAIVCIAPCSPSYSLFRPEVYWWRLLLTLRKLSEVTVALMFNSAPLFQAWCVHCCGGCPSKGIFVCTVSRGPS
jgi:hypothetical protein